MKPKDSFEFVKLLRNQPLLANKRDDLLLDLAQDLKSSPDLLQELEIFVEEKRNYEDLKLYPNNHENFFNKLDSYFDVNMNIVFQGQALDDEPRDLIHFLIQLVKKENKQEKSFCQSLEKKFLDNLTSLQIEEGNRLLEIAKISWKLRDDDNILMSQLEYELLRVLKDAKTYLSKKNSRLDRIDASIDNSKHIQELLLSPMSEVGIKRIYKNQEKLSNNHCPRQMRGQPAARGFYRGPVRIIKEASDLAGFKLGEVLVCDAIEPQMTYIISIAGAIIERRGGMLIHGAIIARELSIPCVNGVDGVMDNLKNGQIVSVDGYLGLVVVGNADFETEFKYSV